MVDCVRMRKYELPFVILPDPQRNHNNGLDVTHRCPPFQLSKSLLKTPFAPQPFLCSRKSELRLREERERENGGDVMGGERGRLLLNGNGPNEQSPLHSAILRLICAFFLVLFSADNAFGKRKREREREREGGRGWKRTTLNKLCAIAAAADRRRQTRMISVENTTRLRPPLWAKTRESVGERDGGKGLRTTCPIRSPKGVRREEIRCAQVAQFGKVVPLQTGGRGGRAYE